VRTQIHLTDGGYFDAPVDYCKGKALVIQQALWFGSDGDDDSFDGPERRR